MLSLKASERGLEIVDRARKKKGWTKTVTLDWWETALTSQATLRRFWRRQSIQRETFIKICEVVGVVNWQEIVDSSAVEETEVQPISLQDWCQAPDIGSFYGRTEELVTLKQWIVSERCRLVTLSGMGGIGKTALAAMLAEEIQDEFDYLIWRSLRTSPPVESVLIDMNQVLYNETEAYDATRALIAALGKKHNPNRRDVQQALSAPNFQAFGATGKISFNGGDRNESAIALVKVVPSNCSTESYAFVPVNYANEQLESLQLCH